MFARRTSASAAAIAGFFGAAALPRATWPLIDGDVWWHIRAGEEVLRTGKVPSIDTWSIVGAGRPWVSQDWLANVLLAAGNSLGPWGQTALSLLFGGIAVLAFWILWRAIALRVPQIGWVSRIVWLSVGLAIGGPVMGVRVQVLDLLMAAIVIWICWRYLVDPRRRWLIGLPVVAAAWANLHAGWVLLFLIVGAVLVGEATDRILRREPSGSAPLAWSQQRDLGLAMLAAVAALAVNPNGVALYGYPFYTVGITALNRYVMEWFPASLGDLFGQMLAAFVLVGVLPALVFGRRRMRTADALIVVGLCVMAWRAIRFLLIVGPIGGAIVAVVLAPVISQSALGQRFAPILSRLSGPPVRARGWLHAGLAVFLIVLGLSISLLRVSPPAQAAEIARVLPAQAATWLDLHPQGSRLFNRYEWGGYLGEHRPSRLVFMDGRADVYGDALLQMYVSIISVDPDPEAILDRYGIDHAVFPPDTPLAAWFDASPSWERVYSDATAAIWVRR
jgi:hypothetical protein